MELRINDYVRIHTLSGQGGIAKLEKIDDICITDKGAVDKNNIIKSSPNIIDLIEVGDYVNGCLVSEIKDKWLILNYADIETYEQLERKNENIKSIVTHEQFESMEYKL